MTEVSGVTPSPDPSEPTVHHIKVPAAYEKAGFSEKQYTDYLNLLIKQVSDSMNKIAKKQIDAMKEHRRKIESGEE